MTKDEAALLYRFEAQVSLLIERYQDLQQKCVQLEEQLEERSAQLRNSETEKALLREQLVQVKLAKLLDVSDFDLKETRGKINKLIREVDKCIALLNV